MLATRVIKPRPRNCTDNCEMVRVPEWNFRVAIPGDLLGSNSLATYDDVEPEECGRQSVAGARRKRSELLQRSRSAAVALSALSTCICWNVGAQPVFFATLCKEKDNRRQNKIQTRKERQSATTIIRKTKLWQEERKDSSLANARNLDSTAAKLNAWVELRFNSIRMTNTALNCTPPIEGCWPQARSELCHS